MKRTLLAFVLAIGTLTPAARLRAQGPLDRFTFFVGDSSLWPRTGSHYLNQVSVPGSYTLTHVKFGDPGAYAVNFADANLNIYFWEERDPGGNRVFRYTDNLWLHRYMSVGDVIEHPNNRLLGGDLNCNLVSDTPWPYTNVLEAYWPQYNVGGDLGVRDVILLKQIPLTSTGYFERFYYAQGAGFVAWEQWNNGVMEGQTIFTTLGGPNTQPIAPCSPPPTP